MKQSKSRGKEKKGKRYTTSFFKAWIHAYNVKIHEIFHANSLSPSCDNVALPYFLFLPGRLPEIANIKNKRK